MNNDEIKSKRKEKWLEVSFSIEALAVSKDVVEEALKKHVDHMSGLKGIYVYDTVFHEAVHVKKPMKGIEEAYSQVARVKFFAKNFSLLIDVVMAYGPSSVEILGPSRHELGLSEAQEILNNIAGVVHQFAAAGAGGIVIAPDKNTR